MGERVVADLVAVAHQLTDNVGMPRDLTADDEERCADVRGAQHGGDLRCPARVGPVVERQRHAPPGRRLARDELAADRSQDRPQSRERRRSVDVVRLGARTDRVRRETFEEDERGDDQQAEAEQSPVGGWAPDAAPVRRAQGFFPCPSALPGTVATVVVVAVVVVVVVRFACPGATADFPRSVVDVCPGATPERPRVVVVFVCPGATADFPCAAADLVFVVAGAATGAGSAGTRSAGVGATGLGT
jgi:hypothetical protein